MVQNILIQTFLENFSPIMVGEVLEEFESKSSVERIPSSVAANPNGDFPIKGRKKKSRIIQYFIE